ncbi:MAG: PKD domain-containing protein [Geothrix sp.]|uniref:PKD domain-containing protein n=1 Tax=Geothrix sp. TaxID=1962974 RepID=UPI0017A737BA|nr:PKD domain-containing protein [Geothrix sp.]NWJ41973.1 PKD domain-containing protein [Geothrix sp.]WIL20054.1 MAG: PKD domain-containing protein [Geothrix sp.]
MKSRILGLSSLLGVALLTVPHLNCGKGSSQNAQTPATDPPATAAPFTYTQVASGLARPTGLALGGANTLVVSQESTNPLDASIARVDLRTGALRVQGADPAVRSGIAANHAGRLYWVDANRGALMTQGATDGAPSVLHAGGMLPATALAVDSADRVYLAGTTSSGGTAAVIVRGGAISAIPDPAGPEKTTLVAAASGDLYWTSSAAGLIYHRAPDGSGGVVLSGLKAPRGLALDTSENLLYFTEVPTPGVAGASGGKNTVNALDLTSMTRTVIHSGDPQPSAVAVAPNGNVYWTSTSRGVVMAAVPSSAPTATAQFTATLSGGDEVPPVTTQATGQATFSLASGSSVSDDHVSSGPALRYTVSLTGIRNVRRIEIRQGLPGATGALVATLSRGEDFGEEDDDHAGSGFAVSGRIRARNLKGPFAGDWVGFSAALANGSFYLNVLTQAQPTGELRGQILPASGTPTNHPPTATITSPSADVTIQAGQSVSFAGTASDPDGDAVTVLWTFGDGSTSSMLSPGSHLFPMAGTYTVRLTATDAKGLVDPNPPTRTVTVQAATGNQAPVGTITAPVGNVTVVAGQPVSFSGMATDPDGNSVTVLWTFGDGGTSTLLSPGNHVYSAAGTYTVRFTATDSLGLADPNPPTRTITVQPAAVNQPPDAVITAPAANVSITAGQAVSFTGTVSDPNGDTVTVLWSFGDGSTSTLLAPGNHTFATAGTYTVTLTATDSKGLADPTPATRTITVTAGGTAPTLTQLQTTIFTPLCIGCHGQNGDAGMNLTAGNAYANLVNVAATTRSGLRVVPGSPGTSALVAQLAGGHRSVSAANQSLISAWITAGALNN